MSQFGDAFKAARAAGKKSFSFNGKSYHTQTADDLKKLKPAAVKAKPRTAPAPAPKPRAATPPAKPRVNHMAGIGAAPTRSRARSADLQPAAVTATRKTGTPSTRSGGAAGAYERMRNSPGGVPGRKKSPSTSGSTVTRVNTGPRVVSKSTPSKGGGAAGAYERMKNSPGGVPGRKR